MDRSLTTRPISRRTVLGGIGALAAVGILAACAPGGGAGSSSQVIKFWDLPWGQQNYSDAVKKITTSYKPTSGKLTADFQLIQWNNFYQTFSSAVAAKSGPTVSTGGAFQAFQLADAGAIAYADDLLDALKKSGVYDDFLPGTVDALKTKNGYVGVPWNVDVRPLWYRKSLLEKAGVEPPTDWDSWITVGKALKGVGASAFGTGAGANNNIGYQGIVSLMINNGGGLFDEDQNPDVVTDRNIETMDFIREMAGQGIIDPASVSYSSDNLFTQWKNGGVGIGIHTPGLNVDLGDTSGDLAVMSPVKGPHGDTGTLSYTNSLMMYTDTPSQAASEEFLAYYIEQLPSLWQEGVIPVLPARASTTELPEFQANAEAAKVIAEWQPIGKSLGNLSTAAFSALSSIDGGQALFQFSQTMLAGQTDSKTALETLQSALESVSG